MNKYKYSRKKAINRLRSNCIFDETDKNFYVKINEVESVFLATTTPKEECKCNNCKGMGCHKCEPLIDDWGREIKDKMVVDGKNHEIIQWPEPKPTKNHFSDVSKMVGEPKESKVDKNDWRCECKCDLGHPNDKECPCHPHKPQKIEPLPLHMESPYPETDLWNKVSEIINLLNNK